MGLPLIGEPRPDTVIPEHALRLMMRARSVLSTAINSDSDEPLPDLARGVMRRLHADICDAIDKDATPCPQS
jgi:hypothetical protein